LKIRNWKIGSTEEKQGLGVFFQCAPRKYSISTAGTV